MMFHRELNIVIITPMKCGSTTLEESLRFKDGWAYVMGPHPWDHSEIEKHTDRFPYLAKWQRAKRLLLIRHPFNRVASLFNHYSDYNGNRSFEEWLEIDFKSPYHDACATMYPEFDDVIRLEHLREDLEQHGINVEHVPHANQSRNRSRIPEWAKPFIRERYAADFPFYQSKSQE